LRPEIQPRVLDAGEPMKAPGRRFSYSEAEFLEAYLGKDYARAVDLREDEHNQTFGFQESLKELIPDRNEFLELPKEEERIRKLNEWMGTKLHDGKAMDEEFRTFRDRFDHNALLENAMKEVDEPHPTEEGRT